MITRYVNTASTAGGDGTTNAIVGANRAWATLSEAEAALYSNKPSEDLKILCGGSVTDSIVTIRDITTSVAYTITIEGNPNVSDGNHFGKWDTNCYRIEDNSSGDAISLNMTSSARIVFVKNIQIKQTGFDGDCATFFNTSDGTKIQNCLMWMDGDANNVGVRVTSNGCVNIENCVIQKDTVKTYGHGVYLISGIMRVINTIVRGFRHGVVRNDGISIITNCEIFDNNDSDFDGTNTVDHCASDDGDGTNPVSVTTWAQQFVNPNYATDLDFRLRTDSELLKQGIGPASDVDVPVKSLGSAYRNGLVCDVGPFERTSYKSKQGFAGVSTQSGLG